MLIYVLLSFSLRLLDFAFCVLCIFLFTYSDQTPDVVQWLVQRFRSERLRVRSRRSATFTPSAHVRRQSSPVWPPTLNNYLYLYLYLHCQTPEEDDYDVSFPWCAQMEAFGEIPRFLRRAWRDHCNCFAAAFS